MSHLSQIGRPCPINGSMHHILKRVVHYIPAEESMKGDVCQGAGHHYCSACAVRLQLTYSSIESFATFILCSFSGVLSVPTRKENISKGVDAAAGLQSFTYKILQKFQFDQVSALENYNQAIKYVTCPSNRQNHNPVQPTRQKVEQYSDDMLWFFVAIA